MGSPERVGGGLRPVLTVAALGLASAALALVATVVALGALPGWSAAVVSSGSMGDALPVGSVVVNGPPPEVIEVGDIVTFRTRSGALVTHRVEGLRPEGTIVTKGDANVDADSTPVRPSDVVGVGRVVVPLVGTPVLWWRDGNLAAVLLLLAAAAVVWLQARWEPEPLPMG